MPILNYSTTIPIHNTIGELIQILAKAGALAVNVTHDGAGNPIALTFVIKVRNTPIDFRLPTRHDGIWKILQKNTRIERKFRTEEHARRVAWRITKDWVEAQLAIIEAGQAELAEVFLPYALSRSGETIYEEFKNGYLLGSGREQTT